MEISSKLFSFSRLASASCSIFRVRRTRGSRSLLSAASISKILPHPYRLNDICCLYRACWHSCMRRERSRDNVNIVTRGFQPLIASFGFGALENKMKIAAVISRYLLGLLFSVFGLNGFLHFIHQPPPANPVAIQFFVAVSTSHYMMVVFLVLLVAGLMPLALAVLAPVLVNILNYHITMDPGGIGPGLTAAILWVIVFLRYRSSFAHIFQQRPAEETAPAH